MAKIVSIVLASKHKQNLSGLFANLEDTAKDMDSFEVLVKVDDDNLGIITYLEAEQKRRPFSITYAATPRLNGYWSLWLAYNELWKMSSSETYFVVGINDETRFATRHWDDILRGYVGYFPDDVFHLRISQRRHLELKSLVECIPYGESYGFFTKKWLSLTEGLAVGEAAVDTGQECVNYFLRTQGGYFRGVAVDTIKVENEEIAVSASHGLSEREFSKKLQGIFSLYAKLLTRDRIENFYRLAQKLTAYIWASESSLSHFRIEDDRDNKEILVKISSESGPLKSLPYKVDFLTWVSILFDIEPVCTTPGSWNTWPPLLAARIYARRQLAQLCLSTPPEQLENAYLGDLGKAYKKLLSIRVRHKPLTTVGQFYINKLVKNIASGCSELDESAFVNDLLDRILDRADRKIPVQDLLAARLYCFDGELLSQGFDLTLMPEWLLSDLSLSKVQKYKQMLKKFMPYPVRRALRLMLLKTNNLIEKFLE